MGLESLVQMKKVKMEKKIVLPTLRIPVRVKPNYVIYYELVMGVIDILEDTERSPDGSIEGWVTLTSDMDWTLVDTYLFRVESLVPPKIFLSRTRWIYIDDHWEALFTDVYSNIDDATSTCYCYTPNERDCTCGAKIGEDD